MIVLEEESSLNVQEFSKEIHVIRQVILEGDFDGAYKILDAFKNKSNFPYKSSLLAIKKQHFFELIENSNTVI